MARIQNNDYDKANFGKFEKLNGDYFLKTIQANSSGDFITPFIPHNYDELAFTYVAAGNGEGQVETVTFKLSSATVATLTFTYDADHNVSGVAKS